MTDISERSADTKLRTSQPNRLLVFAAAACWTVTLALLLLARLSEQEDILSPQRLLFYISLPLAGLLTFVPLQRRTGLRGLALEGVGGTTLLLYTIAFVPPPTGWLLSLPDMPVYLLFILAAFWTATALAQPLIYAAGTRMFKSRVRRLDLRRTRRQSYEVGLLVALSAFLAGLRVLTPISFLLVALILLTVEILFLARVRSEHDIPNPK